MDEKQPSCASAEAGKGATARSVSAETTLAASGRDDEAEVAELLGHADATLIRRVYGHALPARRSEEVYETGEAYHAPPGHTPTLYAGTEIVEFSPTEPLQQTIEVVMRNIEAASS